MSVIKLAESLTKKYSGNFGSEYDEGPWKRIEGPVDTSLGVPYSAAQATYYKDQLALLWDKVNGPDKELWDRFFKIADSSSVNLPAVKRFKILFNDFVARIKDATIKDTLLLCADMMSELKDLREQVNITRTSEMPPPVRAALDDLIYRVGTRVWERTKKILSIYDIRKGIMNSPEILELFSASGKGSWHHGPMMNPFKENPPTPQPGNVPARTKLVSLVDANIWEDVDKKMPFDGTNEKDRTKLFNALKKQYNEKARASKK